MIENISAPISKVTARDLLKASGLIPDGPPTMLAAAAICEEERRRGGYIAPDYFFDVWTEVYKTKKSDQRKEASP